MCFCFLISGEGYEPAFWKASEAVRNRRSVAAEERLDSFREMAQDRSDSEEEEDFEAEVEGSSSFEPVYEDTRQKPRSE